MPRFSSFVLSLLAMVVVVGSACGTPARKPDRADVGNPNRPKWVRMCGGAMAGDEGRVIYGCGQYCAPEAKIRQTGDAVLNRAAEDQARASIAKQMDTFSQVLSEQYEQLTQADGVAAAEANVRNVIRNFSEARLHGVALADTYKEYQGEAVCVFKLVKLSVADMSNFLAQAEQAKTLGEKTKEAIRKAHDGAMKSLDSMSEKLREREDGDYE